MAYDNGNERNAAYVTFTATVLLPRTLRPNSALNPTRDMVISRK